MELMIQILKPSFLDLHLSISNGFILLYDKRDDIDFDIIRFPVLDGDVPTECTFHNYLGLLECAVNKNKYKSLFGAVM